MPQDQPPDIKVKFTVLDFCIEAFAVFVIVATWGFLIFRFICPDAWPDVFKQPDLFGDIFPLALGTWLVFNALAKSHFPTNLYKHVKITKENAERQYHLDARSRRWTNVGLACFFSCLIISGNLIRTDATRDWCDTAIASILICMIVIGLYYHIRAKLLK